MKSITILLIALLSATAGVLADDTKPASDPNVPFHISQLSPEQQELANEICNELGWRIWSLVSRFFVEEPAALVEGEGLEIDRMADEYFHQFESHLNVELLFLRKACDLPSHEMQSLTDSCQAVLKISVRDFVLRLHGNNEAANTLDDELAKIYRAPERVVMQVAECQLSAEQWGQFSHELKARTAQRRRMTIHCLVARLDLDLMLSMTQREQFVKLFESRWQDAWGLSLSALTEQYNFMPELPTEDVATILNETQQQKLVELAYSHDLNWDDEPLDLVAALDRVVVVEDDPADDEGADDENDNSPPMDH